MNNTCSKFISTALSFIVVTVFFIMCCAKISAQSASENQAVSFDLSADSAIMINADTGTVLYAKNENQQRAIASTTKIMTALLTIEAGNLDEKFTVDSTAIRVEGTSMGLREGDIVTRRALCYGMLLPSGNDAANAAAVNISGTLSGFAELMNKKAQQLEMNSTRFANPSGLDAENHYSTAADMAILARYALKNEVFRSICCMSSASVEFGNPPYQRRLANSNKMLWNYEGCIGMKTGFTDNARRCLVTAAERDGVRVIAVTLNAPNDWQDHKLLLDYGFACIDCREFDVDPGEIFVPVVGSNIKHIAVVPETPVTLPLSDDECGCVTTEILTEPFLYAGFQQGSCAGKIVYKLNGVTLAASNLVTVSACEESSDELGFFEGILQYFAQLFDW